MNVRVDHLSFGYAGKDILHEISLKVNSGEVLALIGPNGSGKTTLLKSISRVLVPKEGSVYLDFNNLAHLKPKEIARFLAAVEQEIRPGFDFTVEEIVRLGRIPYAGTMGGQSRSDQKKVERSMQKTDILRYASRSIFQLSSGERQRVWIAMALAQDPTVLLMDEPTSYLDINYQVEIFELMSDLAREGLTIITSVHELTLAANYADRIALMKEGKIVAVGKPHEILTEKAIEKVFGIGIRIVNLSGGAIALVPLKNRSCKEGEEEKQEKMVNHVF